MLPCIFNHSNFDVGKMCRYELLGFAWCRENSNQITRYRFDPDISETLLDDLDSISIFSNLLKRSRSRYDPQHVPDSFNYTIKSQHSGAISSYSWPSVTLGWKWHLVRGNVHFIFSQTVKISWGVTFLYSIAFYKYYPYYPFPQFYTTCPMTLIGIRVGCYQIKSIKKLVS